MKKIALISSYCDTEDKVQILIENIRTLKNIGLDTLVISPIPLPSKVIELSDFVFFTKENPLLLWPIRSFTFWKTVYTENGWVMMHHNLADYGWAGLYQVKKLSEIALSYNYDLYYHLIYDLEIDEVLISEILNNEKNLIHPRINPKKLDELWEATLHFMVFDKETMKKIVDNIDLDEYLKSNGVAEGQALKWANEVPLKISKHPVKDKIYYWEDTDFFNYSKNPNYKLFFNKNEESEIWVQEPPVEGWISNKTKIFFYDVKEPFNLKIFLDNIVYNYNITDNTILNFENDSTKIVNLIIDDGKYLTDFSDTIKKINRNLIYYEDLPFSIEYNDTIKVLTYELTNLFKNEELPLKIEFVRTVNNKNMWDTNISSNSWAVFPNSEMVDVLIKNKYDRLIHTRKWDIKIDGDFIYKKIWNYCNNRNTLGLKNKGVVVGTHNGEFGEWVPVAIDNLSNIVLVEASQKQFETLIENYRNYENLQFVNELVTKDGGNVTFYEGGEGYTNTVVKRVIDYWEKEPITETERVSIKFSDLITEDVNWIHTDVEGIDYELIMSLSDNQLSHLDIIIYEYNNSTPDERELINNYLIEKGYKTYREKGVSIAFRE
jgi:FkbM family methyltransferase